MCFIYHRHNQFGLHSRGFYVLKQISTVNQQHRKAMESSECNAPKKKQLTENYYIPPPARKQQINEETTKEKLMSSKQREAVNENNKACNNSSLLFEDVEKKSDTKKSKLKSKKTTINKTIIQESSAVGPTVAAEHCKQKDSVQLELNHTNSRTQVKSTEINNVSLNEKSCENIDRETSEQIHQAPSPNLENKTNMMPDKTEKTSSKPKNIKKSSLKLKKVPKSNESQDSKTLSLNDGSTEKPKTQQKTILNSNNETKLTVEENDWESLYNDVGDCLVPKQIDELSKKVSAVKINKPKNISYDESALEEKDSCTIIEIYGFSEDLTTNDLIKILGSYVARGFHLKWVDDTHALGIFSSPLLAEEVLSTDLPNIKTRPISKASQLSQAKARSMVLPSALRPKTCTALARRLVTGALGIKMPVSPEQRAAEKELLREARENRKQAAKDRDAAWEGNFGS